MAGANRARRDSRQELDDQTERDAAALVAGMKAMGARHQVGKEQQVREMLEEYRIAEAEADAATDHAQG